MKAINNLTPDQLYVFFKQIEEPKYRAQQVFHWLFHKGAASFDEMTNLSLSLRKKLNQSMIIDYPELVEEKISTDGSSKFLLRLSDNCLIESVLLKEKERITLCVSTQVGCRMGCIFCLTGKKGFVRNLTQSEIVTQVLLIKKLKKITNICRLNIVLMGMGEPLDNYNSVLEAIKIMISGEGLTISPRRITLSTCGIIPALKKLSQEEININLAVSLNATSDKMRSSLMPINKKYPLKDLLGELKNYPLKKNKRITFEYILFDGINDSPGDALALAKILKDIRCKINLIAFNNIEEKKIKPAPEKKILTFQNILWEKKITVVIRKSKGADIMAACGQLYQKPAGKLLE